MNTKRQVVLAGVALSLAASAGLAQDATEAYRSEVMSDAGQRSSLLAAGASGHHEDGHFGWTDASGNNSLNIGLFGQARWFFNFRDDKVGENDDFTHGGQLSRVRLFMFGTVASPDFSYFVQFAADSSSHDFDSNNSQASSYSSSSFSDGGSLEVLDYWAQWDFEGGMHVRAGQGRPVQGFEEMTQPWDQQFFERSLPNDLFSPGRQQFVELGYTDEQIDGGIFISDGAQSANTDFTNPNEADFAFGGQINVIFEGDREQFVDQSSAPGAPFGFRAGIGGQYETHGDTGIGTSDFDAWYGRADVEVRGDGWSARGNVYIVDIDPDGGTDGTHYGASVRGGIFLDPQWELYGGWEGIFLDDDIVGSDNDSFNFIRVGVNHFPFADSRAVTISAEGIYAFDETGALVSLAESVTSDFTSYMPNLSRHNILGNASGEDGEFGFGAQLEVLN